MVPTKARERLLLSLLAGVVATLVAVSFGAAPGGAAGTTVDEVHYTYAGPTSVTFDWRGDPTDFRYGSTTAYGTTLAGQTPSPLPSSSTGPFREVTVTGLSPGATYHYSIGGSPDHTFSTAPTGSFRFDVIADIGSSLQYQNVTSTAAQVAADNPNFVLMVGDLTYGNSSGQTAVDQHFNDEMQWSQSAAYMPVWGNHEWETPALDDLRNYKGRFGLPNSQTSLSAPSAGCCGEDWGWFDAGGVRFVSYPDKYTAATWTEWQTKVDPVMAAAQANPNIRYIVTFGHRPAYSTGFHPGDTQLAAIIDAFGDTYSKYVLNLNGHSHDYERFTPIHGVTHITAAGGGSALEPPWSGTDSRSVYRAMHLEHVRVDVAADGIRIEAVCGPATAADDSSCVEGNVIDTYTIGTAPPAPPPVASTLYVDRQNPACADTGSGTQAQPFCSISAAAARTVAGSTVLVASGTYDEQVTPNSGAPNKPVVFAPRVGAQVTITGKANGFKLSGRNWVTIQGFNITGTTSDGILVSAASNVKVLSNHVSYNGQPVSGKTGKGIKIDNTTDSLVAYNVVDHTSDFGIQLTSGATRNQVIGNHISFGAQQFQRAASGIRLYAAPGNTIAGNIAHDNEDSGIEVTSGSNDNLVSNNVSYNNGDHGIDTFSSTGVRVISNSVYKNFTSGINVEGASTGATLANNISVANAVTSTRTRGNIRVDQQSVKGTAIDYDLVSIDAPNVLIQWGNADYGTIAAFRSATKQETHGIQADPKWVAPASGDFDVKLGSPATDSADSGASGQSGNDVVGTARLDDPFTPNTGAGPRAYDDRGAYEFEPPDDLPPAASLKLTPSSGKTNLTVTADASASTDTDPSPIATYSFDFGDGSSATAPQAAAAATHTYTAAGTYTATVTVTDTNGFSSTAAGSVTATDLPPNASLTVAPASGFAPLAVTADASGSTDADATPIASYSFDFGDGSPATAPQASATAPHTYTTAGDYTVTVTARDTAGLSSTATAHVTVTDNPPDARVSVSPTSGIAPLTTTADASASTDGDGTPIASYRFDFGDGTVVGAQPGAVATHAYTTPGTYTITTTVTDTGGLSATATAQVTVIHPDNPPSAALVVSPTSGTAPAPVTADAAGSTDDDDTPIAGFRFDFGDGTGAVGPQLSSSALHTYTSPGTYTVTVTVTDTAGLSASKSAQVTITADNPPAAALAVTPSSGSAPLAVSADASGSTDTDATPIASYTFDFGDGTAAVGPQAGATVPHTYTAAGNYTVTVTVTDTAGKNASATVSVSVGTADAPPAAALSLTTTSGTAPLTLTADASGSSDADATPIAGYRFDFGDGTAVVGPQPGASAGHVFSTAGTYTVTVIVTDTAGLSASATAQVVVAGGDAPPAARLAVNPSSGAPPLTVTADGSGSTDTDATPIASYTFDFGDGTAVVGPQPGATAGHVYNTAGTYTVTVTVRDTAGLSSTATARVTVAAGDAPPAARLTLNPSAGAPPLTVTADASASTDTDSTPIATYRFDFGDGTAAVGPQAQPTASHTYAAAGTFTVVVTVKDTAGLSSTATSTVSADAPPNAKLTLTPALGPAGMTVTADSSGSTDTDATPIATYSFDFGDGTGAGAPQAAPTSAHVYANAGTFAVKVTVKDTAGVVGTATAQVVVKPNFARNSGFETDLSGWNTSGSSDGATLARVSGGHTGSWSAKLTNGGAAAGSVVLNDTPNWVTATSAPSYAAVAWARADTPGAVLRLRFREYNGSTLVGTGTSQVTLTTNWQQVTLTYTTASPGASTLDYNAYVTGLATGGSFYVDDAAVYLP